MKALLTAAAVIVLFSASTFAATSNARRAMSNTGQVSSPSGETDCKAKSQVGLFDQSNPQRVIRTASQGAGQEARPGTN